MGCVIEKGCAGSEILLTTATINPSFKRIHQCCCLLGTMLPNKVNDSVTACQSLKCTSAAWTFKNRSILCFLRLRMLRGSVNLQSRLRLTLVVAMLTGILEIVIMALQMIMHCILILFRYITMRTHKLAIVILRVCINHL